MLSGAMGSNPFGAAMQQMTENPELLRSMMQSPQVQQMMQAFVQNPGLMQTAINENPLFAANPQIQDQMRNVAQSLNAYQNLFGGANPAQQVRYLLFL